jgi:hypothetical protein
METALLPARPMMDGCRQFLNEMGAAIGFTTASQHFATRGTANRCTGCRYPLLPPSPPARCKVSDNSNSIAARMSQLPDPRDATIASQAAEIERLKGDLSAALLRIEGILMEGDFISAQRDIAIKRAASAEAERNAEISRLTQALQEAQGRWHPWKEGDPLPQEGLYVVDTDGADVDITLAHPVEFNEYGIHGYWTAPISTSPSYSAGLTPPSVPEGMERKIVLPECGCVEFCRRQTLLRDEPSRQFWCALLPFPTCSTSTDKGDL